MLCIAVLALAETVSFARLGDTREQAEDRYGPPDKTRLAPGQTTLLEGAREWMFEYRGWMITCAMLLATDGHEYVARERYQKIWNSKVMKEGGTPSIRDFEENAILEAEGGASRWTRRFLDDGKGAIPKNLEGVLLGLLTPAWVRSDGAVAYKFATHFTLELPQARMREAELKSKRERQQRENAKDLFGSSTGGNPHVVRPSHSVVSPTSEVSRVSFALAPRAEVPVATPAPPPKASIIAGFLTLGIMGGGAMAAISWFAKKLKPARHRPPRLSRPPNRLAVKSKAEKNDVCTDLTISEITWDDLELLVGEIYRREGYRIELSAGAGADGGVDLTLHRGEEKVLVQCKHWKANSKVPVMRIREFFGVLTHERATRGIFVTTGCFTRDALAFAEGKPIEMIDGSRLEELIQRAPGVPAKALLEVQNWAPVFLQSVHLTIPDCPMCTEPMTTRKGRHGTFWGCRRYPRCRGKRDMRRYVTPSMIVAESAGVCAR